jgi:hypothetical protein
LSAWPPGVCAGKDLFGRDGGGFGGG